MRKLCLLILCLPILSRSQALQNFNALVQYAYDHSPILKNSALEIEKEKLNLYQIGILSPLQVAYQGGQFNGNIFDSNITLNQDISPLFTKKSQKEQINSEVDYLNTTKEIIEIDLKYKLAVLFENYSYQTKMVDLWKGLHDELKRIFNRVEADYKDKPDYSEVKYYLRNEILDIKNQKIYSELELLDLKSEIQYTANLPDTSYIPDGDFKKMRTTVDSASIMLSLTKKEQELKMKSIDLQKKVNSSQSNSPSISIGGFTESMSQEWFFSGFNIGIGIPIDRRYAKYQNQQLDIEQEEIQNEYLLFQNIISQNYIINNQKMTKYEELINNYEANFNKEKEITLEDLYSKLENNIIDFNLFINLLTKYIKTRTQYLDLVNDYNQIVLEYEYYEER